MEKDFDERTRDANRAPFDLGSSLSLDSPEHFAKYPPQAVFIPAGSVARDAHGHRYGSELFELNDASIDKLRKGQQLAIEICQGEYVLFIQYRGEEVDCQ